MRQSSQVGKTLLLKVIGVSFAASLALFVGFSVFGKKPESNEVKVRVSLLQTSIIEDSSEFIASVVSRRLATLQPPIEGHITGIFVRAGDTVAVGEKIMELVPTKRQKQLQHFKISAPLAGIVDDIPVKEGELVNTSRQLTQIVQNQPLEVNIAVPTQEISKLYKGMPVNLMGTQGRSFGIAKVFFISPSVNNNSQTVLIKALFDNSKGELRTGQQVMTRVIWDKRPGFLIPVTAVYRLGGETGVFVAQAPEKPQPGALTLVAVQKSVKLGAIQGNNYQVLSGLKAGDKIVVSSILNLTNGTPIIPEL
ncbi:secretion protein HlyD [Nostoc commune NIES-4072]|uniref:Secretion protein HlyD n=1 Tax=Nostoc commune NIES-4072 TaxID=2005467 RepID=A0A2R5FY18_NOSCO|nr:efflux RND transporter periplasmic adaptor subunit [Nostoc commune]BBD70967.1 secretion protein HlyD [Nostoc commune HK-02]GBG23656.1 secretion protein HlyD [Nostoc commune NIES-4072]